MNLDRFAQRLGRLRAGLGEVGRVGEALEQRRLLGRLEQVGEPQRPRVQPGGVSAGPGGGRLRGGGQRVRQHRLPVPGRVGVVGQPQQILLPGRRRGQRGERDGVQAGPAAGRQRLLDDLPCDLMPELDRVAAEHHDAGRQAVVEHRQGARRQRFEQPRLDRAGHHRRRVDQVAGRSAEPRGPREHRVLDRRRHRLGSRPEHLGDEERVAARSRVQLPGVDVRRQREPGDGLQRQGGRGEPGDLPAAGQVPEYYPQQVRPVELIIAVAEHQQHRDGADPAGEHPDHVQRRRVRPVHVLEDHRRRLARQQGEQRRRLVVGGDAEGGRVAADSAGQLVHRPHRPGVNRGSQWAHSTRAAGPALAANSRSSVVLPIPASRRPTLSVPAGSISRWRAPAPARQVRRTARAGCHRPVLDQYPPQGDI